MIKTAVTKNLFLLLAKFAPFLNAKIGNREVDVDRCRLSDGADVARPVGGTLDLVRFGQSEDFFGFCDAADVLRFDADIVDPLIDKQRQAIPAGHKQLAHCQWRGRCLAH